jgi:hypothetical protein
MKPRRVSRRLTGGEGKVSLRSKRIGSEEESALIRLSLFVMSVRWRSQLLIPRITSKAGRKGKSKRTHRPSHRNQRQPPLSLQRPLNVRRSKIIVHPRNQSLKKTSRGIIRLASAGGDDIADMEGAGVELLTGRRLVRIRAEGEKQWRKERGETNVVFRHNKASQGLPLPDDRLLRRHRRVRVLPSVRARSDGRKRDTLTLTFGARLIEVGRGIAARLFLRLLTSRGAAPPESDVAVGGKGKERLQSQCWRKVAEREANGPANIRNRLDVSGNEGFVSPIGPSYSSALTSSQSREGGRGTRRNEMREGNTHVQLSTQSFSTSA